MVQIRWTKTALLDLKSIYEFIAKDSKKYAKLELIKLKTRTQLLKKAPLLGKEVSKKGDFVI